MDFLKLLIEEPRRTVNNCLLFSSVSCNILHTCWWEISELASVISQALLNWSITATLLCRFWRNEVQTRNGDIRLLLQCKNCVVRSLLFEYLTFRIVVQWDVCSHMLFFLFGGWWSNFNYINLKLSSFGAEGMSEIQFSPTNSLCCCCLLEIIPLCVSNCYCFP